MTQPDMTNHLLKRGSRYYIRRKIPADLQAHYGGRKEVVKALGTADPAEARRFVREESVRLDYEFEAIRASLRSPSTDTPEAPQRFPELVGDPDTGETLWTGQWLSYTPPRFGVVSSAITEERWFDVHAERKAVADRAEARKVEEARQFRVISRAMRNAGVATAPSLEALPVAAASPEVTPIPKGEKSAGHLAALVEQWAKERQPEAQSVEIMNRVVGRFYEHVGRIPVSAITKAQVVDFKNKLLEAGQTPINTNKQLTMLRTLLNFAVDNLQATANPAEGVKVAARANAKAARLPFDLPALQAIFGGPVYTEGFRPEGVDWDVGAAYWFPLIALYTGARLEEIAQLSPADVYEETYYAADDDKPLSAWVFRFTNAGEGQGVKTDSSVRRIPVHSVLIERGFIELARSRAGKSRIFSMPPDSRGREGANWGKWFGKYLRSKCKVTDPLMAFHSFRHTL